MLPVPAASVVQGQVGSNVGRPRRHRGGPLERRERLRVLAERRVRRRQTQLASRLYGSAARIFSRSGMACAYCSATKSPDAFSRVSKSPTMSAGRGASLRTTGGVLALT